MTASTESTTKGSIYSTHETLSKLFLLSSATSTDGSDLPRIAIPDSGREIV